MASRKLAFVQGTCTLLLTVKVAWLYFGQDCTIKTFSFPSRVDQSKVRNNQDKNSTNCIQMNYYRDCAVFESTRPETILNADEITWKRFNPALAWLDKNKYVYLERQNRIIREVRKSMEGKAGSFWVKTNRLVFTELEISDNQLNIAPYSVVEINPFQNQQSELMNKWQFDCELQPDYNDGGHGVQDPRLVRLKSNLLIVFNSRHRFNVSGVWCDSDFKRSMYVGELRLRKLGNGNFFSPRVHNLVRLQMRTDVRNEFKLSDIEKNWSPFVFNDQLYFSYSFYPQHIVIRCNASSGKCAVSRVTNSTLVFEPLSKFLAQKQKSLADCQPHGGTPAILQHLKNTSYYLGVLHCHLEIGKNLREYFNFPYKIEARFPFRIIKLAKRPLPLLNSLPETFRKVMDSGPAYYRNDHKPGQRIAFASDITVTGNESMNKLMISYGRNDAQARLFEITLNSLERNFF